MDCELVTSFHIEICGFERAAFHDFERRIGEASHTPRLGRVEALRTLACNIPATSKNLREAVDYIIYEAAEKAASDGGDDTLAALVESGHAPLITGVASALIDRRPPAAWVWRRIAAVAGDRSVEAEARCGAIDLAAKHFPQLVRRIANDVSDPAQYCASTFVVGALSDAALNEVLADPGSQLHTAAVIRRRDPVSELCRITSDPRQPEPARFDALFSLPEDGTPENITCLESLLDPATWIGKDELSTLDVVISRFKWFDPDRARAIAHLPLVSRLTIEQQDRIADRVASLW
jgi:hypothetical protein